MKRNHHIVPQDGVCTVCRGPVYPYGQAWRHNYQRPSVEDRFWGRVRKGPGCWVWTGQLNEAGYGILGVNASPRLAHRLSWNIRYGEPPADLAVCHECDNPPCVRPDHLWLGTRGQNFADAVRKGRMRNAGREMTHCKRGHPLSGSNLYLWRGHRHCRACRAVYSHLTPAMKRAALQVQDRAVRKG